MTGWLVALALLCAGIAALGWRVLEETVGEGWGWTVPAAVVLAAALVAHGAAGGTPPW